MGYVIDVRLISVTGGIDRYLSGYAHIYVEEAQIGEVDLER